MEKNENCNGTGIQREYLKSIDIATIVCSSKTISNISSNNPFFSIIITLYILVLLYFPQNFSHKFLSFPILILISSLLLPLLRFNVVQRSANEVVKTEFSQQQLKWVGFKNDPELRIRSFEEMFIESNVGAPLELIFEEFEGEVPNEDYPNPNLFIQRYPLLSLYYPESDSDSSSSEMEFPVIGEWVSSDKLCYRWEEDDEEGMIEIDLDFDEEEDNFIEIDISSLKLNLH